VELTLKYANFEAKFRYQNQIGTPMIVGQNLDIFHIFNIYSFESRPAKHVAPVVIFNSRGSLRPRFFPCIYICLIRRHFHTNITNFDAEEKWKT